MSAPHQHLLLFPLRFATICADFAALVGGPDSRYKRDAGWGVSVTPPACLSQVSNIRHQCPASAVESANREHLDRR